MQYQVRSAKPRRSKFEETGRNWYCGCGKAYLSYSARYTHIRDKHNGIVPEGSFPLTSSRGPLTRIPQNNYMMMDDRYPQTMDVEPGIQKRMYQPSLQRQYVSQFQSDGEFLEEIGALKNPMASESDLDHHYSAIENWMIDYREQEAAQTLLNMANRVRGEQESLKERERNGEAPHMRSNNFYKKCDWALADYLLHLASIARLSFFKISMKYVLTLRSFLNEKDPNFSELNSAQKIPEMLEDLITGYLPRVGFDIPIGILLSHNLTNWLNQKNYSTSLLTLDTGVPEQPRAVPFEAMGPNRQIIMQREKENKF